jgi:signal transduction histidine kinase
MDNPLAKYLTGDGKVDKKLLDQLAFNEKMAELGRMSASVVHEINSPLSVIAAASQMVLDEKDLSEFAVEMIERIHVEAQRLSQMTKGLLSFAREENGLREETDVNGTIRDVMVFLRYEARKRSISVEEELDYQLPNICADVNRLKQIFINLIMNALQAMTEGGCLLLRTSLCNNKEVKIEISDTGAGIAEELIDKIFEPFFTTKTAGMGTGLGLFVTKNNVQALDGRMEVESKVGMGTCFSLYFPAIAT